MTKAQIIKELKREEAMRVKVWNGKQRENGTYFFTDMKKQSQYNAIVLNRKILEKMTDHEFSAFMLRVAKDQFQKPEKTLFDE